MIGIIGGRADRHDGVGHAQAIGDATGGADPDDALGTELDQFAVVDRRAGTTHADRLHADRLTLEGAGVAEHAALLVDATRTGLEERLGDVPGPSWVAGHEHGRGVVGGFGAEVDGHASSVAVGLLEEAGGGVVGEHLAAGLACRAVRNGVAAVGDRADRVGAHRARFADSPVHPPGTIGRRAHVASGAFVGQAVVDGVVDRGDDRRRRHRRPSLPVIANGEILARWQTSLASMRPRPAIWC